MTKNDAKVMDLRIEVDKRKSKLVEVKFMPKTNCQLQLSGRKYNLHTCDGDIALNLAMELNMRLMAASALPAPFSPVANPEEIIMCGYKIKDWMDDLYQAVEVNKYKKERRRLESLEAELDSMLSDDIRNGMRLDEIEKSL